ncbi:quinone oxidoreductase family protein [Saccharospirillum mangrovi]|uniref:quinone oxidoreductase family protein n=1 Tax=Saccharospirillum mangrovi TaxID=2161747 RepID=UPI000D34260E|nr:quinone oxidoreductase [Saccharospirillum mangrovi]
MTHAIRIHKNGGPEVFQWESIEVGDPAPGEVRIRQTAIGLNYIDVYFRTGLYPTHFPAILGQEAAGVVEAVGAGVTQLKEGDRVAYPMNPGAYTEARLIAADKLLKLPDNIADQTAAAMMLKGLTAHYLLHRTYPVKAGDAILVYAAAGGVGQILTQWAKRLGATVIGCVGSADKAELAKAAGADHVINYSVENIAERARELTGGEGVAAAYDSIGKATFEDSLNALRPFGVLASYGNATGPVDPFSPAILAPKGSLYVTRPTLATHISTRALLEDGAERLFDIVGRGEVNIHINQTYALKDVAQAHRDLEARKTTGSTVLLP